MNQKETEKMQRKILFDCFKDGTLQKDMHVTYQQKEEKAEAIEAAGAYDYRFDFKYLLGNYYRVYTGDKHYNEIKEKCIKSKELQGENISDPNPILLWFIYKEIDKKEKTKAFDCDSSNGTNDLMDAIYDRLWREKKERWGYPDLCDRFGGDTMNSFATTFNAFSGEEKYLSSFRAYKKEENREKFDNVLGEYARLTGCLGNFVLVPKGFNPYRGTAKTIKDYWDLSLHDLRCNPSGQGWLDDVNMPFSKYINMFFLWDYVDGSKNTGYRVRPLFARHKAILMPESIESIVLPHSTVTHDEGKSGTLDDFTEFTQNASLYILRRGAFMSAMLRITEKCPDGYDKIVEYLSTDASLGSMDEVLYQLQNIPTLEGNVKEILNALKEKSNS